MTLAHLTHAEFPFLLVFAAAAAGVGAAIGIRLVLRTVIRRKR